MRWVQDTELGGLALSSGVKKILKLACGGE
jgi:hypothetical protein